MAASLTYGIVGLADIGSDVLLSDLGRDRITNVVEMTLARHNAEVNTMIDAFAERTTTYKKRLLLDGGGRLQGTDENGRALVVKPASYDVALPILQGGTAWGSNWVTLQKMSVQRFASLTSTMMNQDLASVVHLMLSGIFHNVPWTFVDDEYGSLAVKTLASGDTDKYPLTGGTELAIDTHYYAQAATIADATNPFPTVRDELLEHGNDLGDVIAFVPTSIQTAVEALTEFVPVSNAVVVSGNGETTIRGSGPQIQVPGKVIGYLSNSKTWIVVLRSLPTGYGFAITERGMRPLAVREDTQPKLRGFRPAGERNDFPYFEEQWIRRIGVGGWNRVGAVAFYFGTSGTYAIPTGFSPKSF